MTAKPIRILHVVDNLGNGGLQNGLANLVGRLDPERFEHILCAIRPVSDADAQPLPQGRARTVWIGEKAAKSRVHAPSLAALIRQYRPAIVHSRNWAAIEAVLAARWVGGCRVIHSEHGIDRDTASGEPWRRSCLRRLAFELADQVLSVSFQIRNLHSQRTGFPARRVSVIHNGVDPQRFSPDTRVRAHVRRELGLMDDELCIGCVGNLMPVKDHLTILKAINELPETHRNWRLLIVGDGPEFSTMRDFLSAHPACQQRVTFLGRSNRIPELLKAMDIYVLASVTEGINNSLLEAMATGLPVVASETGGNPEVIVHDKTGLLFPVGNFRRLAEDIRLLLSRRDLCEHLGRGAMRRVQDEFSMTSMVQKYQQLYENLAASLNQRAAGA